jgi:hypothetical protein
MLLSGCDAKNVCNSHVIEQRKLHNSQELERTTAFSVTGKNSNNQYIENNAEAIR